LLAITGIAVLIVSIVMAYREITSTDARTPVPARSTVADSGSNKTAFVFTIHPQPRVLPAIRFADEKERAMTLQDFRGKFVLLNIWATWCVPCREEMPTLDRLQAKLGGPDFEVVALSIDRGGPFVVSTFYSEIGIRALRIYVDKTGDAATDLGVVGLPATLLIDREGREIGRKIGPAEWDSPEVVTLIQGYLGAPAPDQPGRR
jgi:thiol-disulfide isomerase/thioredoxin